MPTPPVDPKFIDWITTEDGSVTGYRSDLGLHYKSIFGAQTESRKVFVEGTGITTLEQQWTVGELGFGLGSNFSQTAVAAEQCNRPLLYIGIDFQPPPAERTPPKQPYSHLIQAVLETVQHTGQTAEVSDGQITLRLHPNHWNQVTDKTIIDAAFHDPFAPANNPESWTAECFNWWKGWLNPNARLATYSAAGHVRRALASAGFWVARAPGSGRKREITVASRNQHALAQLDIITKYPPQ